MIKRYLKIYILLVLVLSMLSIFCKYEIILDEIWCYGFSKKIADGYIPYRDYNMVQTPLFFFIGSIFSKSILTFRIYGVLINSAISIMTYHICKQNGLSKSSSTLLSVLSLTILMSTIYFATYNTLLLFGLMVLYLVSIKFFKNKNNLNALFFGLNLSILFLIKQNVSAILICVFTVILIVLLIRNKINYITFICYAVGGMFPVLIFLIYCLLNGSLLEFIDYTILGLKSFSELPSPKYYISELSIAMTIPIITTIFLTSYIFTKKYETRHMIGLILNVASYILIYPIINIHYAVLILILNIPLFSIVLNGVNIKPSIVFKYVNYSLIIALIIINGMCYTYFLSKDGFVRSSISYYKDAFIDNASEQNLISVTNYMKEQENNGLDVSLIVFDAYAYTLATNDNNGVLDLLLRGNIGTISIDEIKLLVDEKDIVLMSPRENIHFVNEIKDYVSENYKIIDYVGNMSVYEKIE